MDIGVELHKEVHAGEVYLVSEESPELAYELAAKHGIPKECVKHIPMSQPLRAGELMEYQHLQPQYLIGDFTQVEIDYLTKP